jgi:hypothetical protein
VQSEKCAFHSIILLLYVARTTFQVPNVWSLLILRYGIGLLLRGNQIYFQSELLWIFVSKLAFWECDSIRSCVSSSVHYRRQFLFFSTLGDLIVILKPRVLYFLNIRQLSNPSSTIIVISISIIGSCIHFMLPPVLHNMHVSVAQHLSLKNTSSKRFSNQFSADHCSVYFIFATSSVSVYKVK